MPVAETEVIVRVEGVEPQRLRLNPGAYVIGRTPEADIYVEAALVSRQHARLTINADHALIEDLGSRNGTLVNGKPANGSVRLWPNQKIQIGAVTIELHRLKAESSIDDPLDTRVALVRKALPEEFLREKKYDIGGVIAKGGMGAILDAREATTERTVAMKVMLDGASHHLIARFITEAKVTAQLEHPNIVPVHELSVDENDHLFYTMKFVKGVTLRAVLQKLRAGDVETLEKFPLAALLTVFQKICDALAFAHSKGVIHRDLKPENLMIGNYGEVLVMDWGLAKVLGKPDGGDAQPIDAAIPADAVSQVDISDREFVTMEGAIMGTPQYMSPEQARGEGDRTDARADIYALGAILYHILALRPPIRGRTAAEILRKVATGEIDWVAHAPSRAVSGAPAGDLPTAAGRGRPAQHAEARALPHLPGGRVPDSLNAVCRKAMALDPATRYQHVTELQRDIAAYQSGFATTAEKAGPWKQFTLFVARNKAVSMATAASLFLLAGLSAAFTLRVLHERNVAVAERKRAEDALATTGIERRRAQEAQTVAETEGNRAKTAQAETETERSHAQKALADFKAEQSRAETERSRADAESSRASKAVTDVNAQSNRAELARAELKKTALTFFGLAKARLTEGKYAEAFEQIGYAIRLNEKSADYVLFRAEVYQVTHKLPEAVADYLRVLALRPGDKVATANLSVCQRLIAENRSAAAGSMLGLISWWKADGAALDSAGLNHGALVSGMTFEAGRIGQAYFFDGKAAYVSIPWSPTLALEDADFSIALWVKFYEFFGQQAFLASEGSADKWAFQYVPGHLQIVVQGKTSATLESAYFFPGQVQWYHIAVTRGGGAVHFYVDGAEVSSERWSGSVPATSAPLTLGHAKGRFFFSGLLDDVRLYSRSLSPTELRALAGVPSEALR